MRRTFSDKLTAVTETFLFSYSFSRMKAYYTQKKLYTTWWKITLYFLAILLVTERNKDNLDNEYYSNAKRPDLCSLKS